MCARLIGVTYGATRAEQFDVATQAITELERRKCPVAQTGAMATRLALAIRRFMSRQPTRADRVWIERQVPACAHARHAQCAVQFRAKCPKPKHAGTYSERISAFTRTALRMLRRPTTKPVLTTPWIAAQYCVSFSLGVTEASSLVEVRASVWRENKNRAALASCLRDCRLTPAVRARLMELDQSWPKTSRHRPPKARPAKQLATIRRALVSQSAVARRLARRRLNKNVARRVLVRGRVLVERGRKLLAKHRAAIPRRVRRRFLQARRRWQRRARTLRRKLKR